MHRRVVTRADACWHANGNYYTAGSCWQKTKHICTNFHSQKKTMNLDRDTDEITKRGGMAKMATLKNTCKGGATVPVIFDPPVMKFGQIFDDYRLF
jgi:hypothetical protein